MYVPLVDGQVVGRHFLLREVGAGPGPAGGAANSAKLLQAVEAVQQLSTISRTACREWAAANFSQEKMAADYLAVYHRYGHD